MSNLTGWIPPHCSSMHLRCKSIHARSVINEHVWEGSFSVCCASADHPDFQCGNSTFCVAILRFYATNVCSNGTSTALWDYSEFWPMHMWAISECAMVCQPSVRRFKSHKGFFAPSTFSRVTEVSYITHIEPTPLFVLPSERRTRGKKERERDGEAMNKASLSQVPKVARNNARSKAVVLFQDNHPENRFTALGPPVRSGF